MTRIEEERGLAGQSSGDLHQVLRRQVEDGRKHAASAGDLAHGGCGILRLGQGLAHECQLEPAGTRSRGAILDSELRGREGRELLSPEQAGISRGGLVGGIAAALDKGYAELTQRSVLGLRGRGHHQPADKGQYVAAPNGHRSVSRRGPGPQAPREAPC